VHLHEPLRVAVGVLHGAEHLEQVFAADHGVAVQRGPGGVDPGDKREVRVEDRDRHDGFTLQKLKGLFERRTCVQLPGLHADGQVVGKQLDRKIDIIDHDLFGGRFCTRGHGEHHEKHKGKPDAQKRRHQPETDGMEVHRCSRIRGPALFIIETVSRLYLNPDRLAISESVFITGIFIYINTSSRQIAIWTHTPHQ